jgi:hypothetical protein
MLPSLFRSYLFPVKLHPRLHLGQLTWTTRQRAITNPCHAQNKFTIYLNTACLWVVENFLSPSFFKVFLHGFGQFYPAMSPFCPQNP